MLNSGCRGPLPLLEVDTFRFRNSIPTFFQNSQKPHLQRHPEVRPQKLRWQSRRARRWGLWWQFFLSKRRCFQMFSKRIMFHPFFLFFPRFFMVRIGWYRCKMCKILTTPLNKTWSSVIFHCHLFLNVFDIWLWVKTPVPHPKSL